MRKSLVASIGLVAAVTLPLLGQQWLQPAGDQAAAHYSPLDQVTPANVSQLRIACVGYCRSRTASHGDDRNSLLQKQDFDFDDVLVRASARRQAAPHSPDPTSRLAQLVESRVAIRRGDRRLCWRTGHYGVHFIEPALVRLSITPMQRDWFEDFAVDRDGPGLRTLHERFRPEIMRMNGLLGVAGWRWLFVIEGLPSIVLGVVTMFYLRNGPRDAAWLQTSERAAIEQDLAAEAPRAHGHGPAWAELRSAQMLLLCLAYFGLVSTLNTNVTWVPQIVRDILGGQADFVTVGVWAAIPALLTIVAMPLWSARSDRQQERVWHVVIPLAAAAVGWLLVVFSSIPIIRFIGLALVSTGGFCAMSVLWTLPASVLSPAARPAGIAVISTAGIAGSAVSPSIIGFLRDRTGTFSSGLLYMVTLLIVSIACVWASGRLLRSHRAGHAFKPAWPNVQT